MSRFVANGVIALMSVMLMSGCTSTEKQLQRIAKDWALTIRASQVIPVYPLTEDLQPGDVFLVDTPIQKQVEMYKRRGFLPLDQMVTRIQGLRFEDFYADAYWDGTFKDVPNPRPMRGRGRSRPADEEGVDAAARTSAEEGDPGETTVEPFDLIKAPRVAFPSYEFSLQRGTGLKVAIPVQGIPVGFGFMGSRSARGSVTLSDAYTYATEPTDLFERLQGWARQQDVKEQLSNLARANPDQTLYLRVVHRVYLVGAVLVSMQSTAARSAGGDVGAAKRVSVLNVRDAGTQENFQAASDALSASLTDGLAPGGSLRIIEASAHAVTLKETFDRPLVIGYLGYDFPILENGALGTPIATQDQLRADRRPADTSTLVPLAFQRTKEELIVEDYYDKYYELEESGDAGHLRDVRVFVERVAATLVGEEFEQIAKAAKEATPPPGGYVNGLFSAINAYKSEEPEGSGWRHNKVIRALQDADQESGHGGSG